MSVIKPRFHLFECLSTTSVGGGLPAYFHLPLQQMALNSAEVDRLLENNERQNWLAGILLRYLHRNMGFEKQAAQGQPVLLSQPLIDYLAQPAADTSLPMNNSMQLVARHMAPYDRLCNVKTKRSVEGFYADYATSYALAMHLPPELTPDDVFDCLAQPYPATVDSYPLSRGMAHIWRHFVHALPFAPQSILRRVDFLLRFFNLMEFTRLDVRLIPQGLIDYLNAPVASAADPAMPVTGLMREVFRILVGQDSVPLHDRSFIEPMMQKFYGEMFATLALPEAVAARHIACAQQLRLQVVPRGLLGQTKPPQKYIKEPVAAAAIDATKVQLNILEWDLPHSPITPATQSLLAMGAMAGFDMAYAMAPNSPWKQQQRTQRQWGSNLLAPINLFYCRPEHLADFMLGYGLGQFEGHHNIGYCHWETSRLSDAAKIALKLLDEIWVPSTFVKEVFQRETDKPVCVMPPALKTASPATHITRAALQLAESAFYFLTVVEGGEGLARKNPLGVIDAFQQAFPNRQDVGLIIKARYFDKPLDKTEEGLFARLQNKIAGDSRVVLLHADYAPGEMAALYMLVDAMVSLHRGSAFGAAVAEAMASGRPVVATAWSGTLDFATVGSALLVDAVPCDVVMHGYAPLDAERGHGWVDPEMASAVKAMQRLVADKVFAKALGEEGQKKITACYGMPALVPILEARLRHLLRQAQGT